jgi:hypothetical protein
MHLCFCLARVYVCVMESILYMHISLLLLLQSSVVAHQQGKYLGLASFLQCSHCHSFILFSSMSSFLRSHRATHTKGLITLMSFYYDYICLLSFLALSLSSSLLPLLSILYYYCHKKTEPRQRTNECRKPLCSPTL